MATPTLTPGFTVLSACDATTGWSGTNTVDSEFYKQGTAGLSGILRTVGNNVRQFTWSGNLTNTHIRLWFSYAAPGAINTKANGGIRLHAVTSTGTIYWYLGGSDTYGGGWTLLTVDTSRTPDSGSGNLANVTAVGFTLNLVSAPRNATNTWYDYLVYGNGMTITGGSTSDAVTLADIYNVDNSNGYGAVQRINGVYFVSTNLTVGGSTNTYVEDDGQIIVFEDQPVNANLYNITPLGSATTSFKIRNSVIKSASTNTRFDLILDNAGLNTLEFTGNTIANADAIRFKSGQSVLGSVFQGCNQIQTAGASFENNTVRGSTDTNGALLWPDGSSVKNSSFSNNSRAIQINTTGDKDFVGIEFSDNTFDINNTSGSSVVVNVSGGGTASGVTSTGSAVSIQSAATLTLTGIQDNSEVRIYAAGTQTELYGIENKSSGVDPAYSYTTPQAVDIVVHNLDYQYWRLANYSLSSSDASLPVSQVTDRNYLNP
jgi:hypothetical protein